MKTIYHYTDIHGLFGVLDKDEFWLTDYRFLNDPSEAIYAEELLEKNKDTILSDCDPTEHEKIYRGLKSTYIGSDPGLSRAYVGSFSNAADQLSQWRGYCSKNEGYCIGFKLQELRQLASTFEFTECIYDADQIVSRWKELAGKYNNFFKEGYKLSVSELLGSKGFEDSFNLAVTGSHLRLTAKDAGYHEEKEIRLYKNLSLANNLNEVCFRPSQGRLVPYIKLKGIKKCIGEIIVGPLGDFEQNYSALYEYKLQTSSSFEVALSKIRFR
ncbi:DUF2971 domain-containing protein [Microbulbifer echini]|uniref:DUF2971 domain-containing protein n=1 Tax=Microbulbifer echini TaxID=1529067 RepID=A0ABV4NQH1_9GAMM